MVFRHVHWDFYVINVFPSLDYNFVSMAVDIQIQHLKCLSWCWGHTEQGNFIYYVLDDIGCSLAMKDVKKLALPFGRRANLDALLHYQCKEI